MLLCSVLLFNVLLCNVFYCLIYTIFGYFLSSLFSSHLFAVSCQDPVTDAIIRLTLVSSTFVVMTFIDELNPLRSSLVLEFTTESCFMALSQLEDKLLTVPFSCSMLLCLNLTLFCCDVMFYRYESAPLTLSVTRFHFLLLYADKLIVRNKLSEEVVYTHNFSNVRILYVFVIHDPAFFLGSFHFRVCCDLYDLMHC